MLCLIGGDTPEVVLLGTLLSAVITKNHYMKVVDSGETAAVLSFIAVTLGYSRWQSFFSRSAHGTVVVWFLFFIVCF